MDMCEFLEQSRRLDVLVSSFEANVRLTDLASEFFEEKEWAEAYQADKRMGRLKWVLDYVAARIHECQRDVFREPLPGIQAKTFLEYAKRFQNAVEARNAPVRTSSTNPAHQKRPRQ